MTKTQLNWIVEAMDLADEFASDGLPIARYRRLRHLGRLLDVSIDDLVGAVR